MASILTTARSCIHGHPEGNVFALDATQRKQALELQHSADISRIGNLYS